MDDVRVAHGLDHIKLPQTFNSTRNMSTNTTQKPAFIFIPDISGFSEFVYETEIEHSRHIISELINLIIASNELDMEVIEIEGDAILFYKEQVPHFKRILQQASKMFIDFHHHLRKYETLRICQCGACSSAANLSLKFIAHSGNITTIDVGNLKKLHGKDVVIAHKLLKNSIPDHEYLLITGEIPESPTISEEGTTWGTVLPGMDMFNGTMEVHYGYVLLRPLLERVPPVEHFDLPQKTSSPFRCTTEIETPASLVQSYLIDLDMKRFWFQGLKGVEYDRQHINRMGTQHTCIVSGGHHLRFRSITDDFGGDKWVYGEKMLNPRFAREVQFYFVTDRLSGAKTRVVFELHVIPLTGYRAIFSFFFKSMLERTFRRSLVNFKNLCEVKSRDTRS